MGYTSYVAAALVLLGLAVVWSLPEDHVSAKMTIFFVCAAIVVAFLGVAYWYANKYPQFSTMAGADIVRWTELQQNAKNPGIIELSAEPQANTAAPQSISHSKEG